MENLPDCPVCGAPVKLTGGSHKQIAPDGPVKVSLGLAVIGPKKLEHRSESRLSEWISRHLDLAVSPRSTAVSGSAARSAARRQSFTFHLRFAGVGSTFPAASMARTKNLCFLSAFTFFLNGGAQGL